jgi:hypothetical protein
VNRRKIRFFDSQSAIVLDELSSSEQALTLVPVREISANRMASDIKTLHRLHTTSPPYVFLHVSVSENDTDEILVWAARRSTDWALLHAISSEPIADTIAEIALSLPVKSVFFVWSQRRLSLAKHYLLRCVGKRTAVPLDTLWLVGRAANGRKPPNVFICCAR